MQTCQRNTTRPATSRISANMSSIVRMNLKGMVMELSDFIQSLVDKEKEPSAPKQHHTDHEHKLQCSCVTWFRYQYPNYKWLLFAIPNGSKRDLKVARKLKAEGVISGVADLFLSIANRTFHGAYIEMKFGKTGRQSENQKEFEQQVKKQGYDYHISRSLDDFMTYVSTYLHDLH